MRFVPKIFPARDTIVTRPVAYDDVRDSIRCGDVALSRAATIEGDAISLVTRSQYTHATMLGWSGEEPFRTLMIGETRQRENARSIDCRSEIQQWPGYYDVFRVRSPLYDGRQAWRFMCQAAGARYGWGHLVHIWGRRRIGRLWPAVANSDEPQSERFCSELVHAAIRLGGGPQLRQYDCDVAPGDLSDPFLVDYLFTLFPTNARMR
jgi:hypothetical protein